MVNMVSGEMEPFGDLMPVLDKQLAVLARGGQQDVLEWVGGQVMRALEDGEDDPWSGVRGRKAEILEDLVGRMQTVPSQEQEAVLRHGIIELAQLLRMEQTRLPKKSGVSRLIRELKARQRGERVKRNDNQPTVLAMGKAGHEIVSRWLEGEPMSDYSVELVKDQSGLVVGAVFQDRINGGNGGEVRQLGLGEEWREEVVVKEDNHRPSLRVELGAPIFGPEKGEEIETWANRQLKERMGRLGLRCRDLGLERLPEKPYEMGKVIADNDGQSILTQIVELGHIIAGPGGAMSLIEETTREGFDAKIDPEGLNGLAAINWLCVAEEICRSGERVRDSNKGVLTELKLGDQIWMTVNLNGESVEVAFTGGVMDAIEVGFPQGDHYGLDLQTVMKHISGLFGSQMVRYRRSEVDEEGKSKETKTRLPKTAGSFLRESRRLGKPVSDEMEIRIGDHKFAVGDGPLEAVLSRESVPVDKHIKQVEEYMFWMLVQLCRVDEWSKNADWNKDEKFPVTVEQVADFALDHGFVRPEAGEEDQSRLKGVIWYRFPDGRVDHEVKIPCERERLIKWGQEIIERRLKVMQTENERAVLKALRLLTQVAEQHVKILEEVKEALPEIGAGWCERSLDRDYLKLDVLAEQLAKGEVKVSDAVEFVQEEVKVVWLDGLKGGSLRLAVDRRGKFTLKGDEIFVTGRVATDRTMVGVAADPERVREAYEENIWSRVRDADVELRRVERINDMDYLVDPDGREVKRVPGKPVVCEPDVLNGWWVLKEDWLREAAQAIDEGELDTWHLAELMDLIKEGNVQGNVYCPLPNHDNRDTEAATFYPESAGIKCRGRCDVWIMLPAGLRERIKVPLARGAEVNEYATPTSNRIAAMRAIMDVGRLCLKHDQLARDYLRRRGLNPDEEWVGLGSIPLELGKSLASLTGDEGKVFWKEMKGRKVDGKKTLEYLMEYGLGEESLELLSQVFRSLEFLPVREQRQILGKLSWRNLNLLKDKGVITPDKYESPVLGGRVFVPLYWPEEGDIQKLVPVNINGRGIVENEKLISGKPAHWKVWIPRTRQKMADGVTYKRRLPAGFAMRDPDQWRLEVGAEDGRLVLCEGPLSAWSYELLVPAVRYATVAIGACDNPALMAFLRHYYPFKTIVLAMDLDGPGQAAQRKLTEQIKDQLEGVEVIPGVESLPGNIKEALPKGKQPGDEGWPGDLGDWNDILTKIPAGEKYAFKG